MLSGIISSKGKSRACQHPAGINITLLQGGTGNHGGGAALVTSAIPGLKSTTELHGNPETPGQVALVS